MRVEIWSDVVCPWCYIGKRRFETALANFEHADDVTVIWRSFELDPHAPFQRGGTMASHLAAKYGMTQEVAADRLGSMDQMAAAEGLTFHLAATKGGNTFAAHRLLHLANSYGYDVGGKVKEALLHAYFIDLQPASDPDVLVSVGASAGLDRDEVVRVVEGDRFADAVREEEALAAALGCTGVPFFVIDRSFAIPGAQDPDTILAVLRRAWDRSHPASEVAASTAPVEPVAAGPAGPACEDDVCEV